MDQKGGRETVHLEFAYVLNIVRYYLDVHMNDIYIWIYIYDICTGSDVFEEFTERPNIIRKRSRYTTRGIPKQNVFAIVLKCKNIVIIRPLLYL